VLRWNRIAHGARAYINGREVGYNEPTGPYQVILPRGVLTAGENEVLLKVAGAAGVRRAESGHFLFPCGQIWGPSRPELVGVMQDVWIDFADRAYMKWILALPHVDEKRVTIRVTPVGLQSYDDLELDVLVRPYRGDEVIGHGEGQSRAIVATDPLDATHFYVDVPLTDFTAWTPQAPQLYTASVRLTKDGSLLDEATVRFGMREVAVVDGNYQLNGKSLWIRGSNLVHEWEWASVIDGHEVDYLVTEARELSTSAFRTHTQPPSPEWSRICDEHGTMLLAEFPLLYNYRNHGYTDEEWEIFHRNAMTDAAGWMSRLWNHPSVIMWVLSNESRSDNAWESGPFRNFVVSLDPTRPTMRTGTTGTKTNYDVHTCGNTNHMTHEGQLQTMIDGWFQQAGGDRTTTNSEYMNIFDRPRCQWTGNDDELADRLAYAQLGMEHTEAMRRKQLDAILPYMYAKWSRVRRGGETWKGGYAWPVSAVWHSSLSPILASLDMFDANYAAGEEVTTGMHLINETWDEAHIHVDLLVTNVNPEFIPEAECFKNALSKSRFDFDLAPDTIRVMPVTWRVPEMPGTYWLTARLTGIEGRPVLSQRFFRSIGKLQPSESCCAKTYMVLGGDDTSRAFFAGHGLQTTPAETKLDPQRHVVVVWNPMLVSSDEKRRTEELRRFASQGGRIVILATRRWDWQDLCDIEVERTGGSRVFPYQGQAGHALLRDVNLESLKRWNGLPGTVAVASIRGPAAQQGKKILWVREPAHTVLEEIRMGEGRLLLSQLAVRDRVLPTSDRYDPAADRILLNLLTRAQTTSF
jgi:hypothetical protein